MDVKIPKSHRNEWKSKRDFEELLAHLNMRLVFPWSANDYGIDGHIEFMSQVRNSNDLRPDSTFFHIQLKSTEKIKIAKANITFQISVTKIIQWYRSNIPVMFVLNDLPKREFYYLWIDDELIAAIDTLNENWWNQKTVSFKIPFQNVLTQESINDIRHRVLSWKKSPLNKIEPGIYFNLKDNCSNNLMTFSNFAKTFNFESVTNSLVVLNNQIEKAIYRIAITGPSRVGKSTLINALLRRKDVSPTGLFQTTAVPIQILPGKEEFIKIYFKNGSCITDKFSSKLIEEYGSQDKDMNENNKKEVTLIAIYLPNKHLEHGVSFFDVPGLDDPDDSIYNYTMSTVTTANAIIYLIDASSMEHGGFVFKSEYKKHILELGQSLDKIFLVFNKVNVLSGNKLELLQARVKADLEKYNLYDKVSNKIYYISAEDSLEARLRKKGYADTVQKLEDDVWAYLLKENKIGLVTLSNIYKQTIGSLADFESILNTRLIDNDKRSKLEIVIKSIKDKIPDLNTMYWNRYAEIKKAITNSLENKKNTVLINLEIYLKSFTQKQSLPDKKVIRKFLTEDAHQTLEDTNKEYAYQVNLLKEMIDNWIEDNLKQVREIVAGNAEKKIIDFSEVENFESPPIDLSSSFGVGLLTGIVGLILNPGGFILAAFAGFIGNWLMSAKERRANNIIKIMEESRKRYDSLFLKITSEYMGLIDDHSKLIIDYANKKNLLFFNDLQIQMNQLNSPLSKIEEKQYQNTFRQIESLRKEIYKADTEIKSLYAVV